MKEYTLRHIGNFLGAELVGDGQHVVGAIAPLGVADQYSISFVASEKYLSVVENCKAGCLILKPAYADAFSGNKLLVEDPYLAYAKISALFEKRISITGVHSTAVVSSTALLGENVAVGANCVIGDNVSIGSGCEILAGTVIGDNTTIGSDCLLHANVTIYSGITIGDRVIIHSGTAIGSDGFGFAPSASGWQKIHQIGGVIIGNDVEIGACTAIDRGAIEDTVIEDGVIIDNQVHIAHNVRIGKRSAIAGCVGIAGSTTIGADCTVAGAVAINGHIEIADNTHFHGGTIVTKGNDTGGQFASATPLMDVKKWRRNSVRYTQLDDLASRLKHLEKMLDSKE